MTVGLIGTGEMARTHARAWRAIGVDVIVHSRNADRGSEFAAEHAIRAEADRAALLETVDVVDICTPTDTHLRLTTEAAGAGKHVMCEKPIAPTMAQAEEMIASCETAAVRLFVGHTLRYLRPYALAREAVRTGQIGVPQRILFHRGGEFPSWAGWFADVERSGGILVDLAIHDIDFARWVFGEVVTVNARITTGPRGGIPFWAKAELQHSSGTVCEITASWEQPGTPFRPMFEIAGSEGRLAFDSLPKPVLRGDRGEPVWIDDGIDPYAEQLADFRAAIAEGRASRVTPADALAALRIARTGMESAAAGKPRPITVSGGNRAAGPL